MSDRIVYLLAEGTSEELQRQTIEAAKLVGLEDVIQFVTQEELDQMRMHRGMLAALALGSLAGASGEVMKFKREELVAVPVGFKRYHQQKSSHKRIRKHHRAVMSQRGRKK